MSFELKNIPISISILHEQEYHNLCKMIHRVQKQRRRRACTEIQKPSLTAVEGLTISNTQMFRLEGAVL
jgi:hypothetical protein